MDWTVVSAVADLAAAVGVIVSLAYLAVQIRSNTKATKADAGYKALMAFADFNIVAMQDSALLGVMARAFDPSCQLGDFQPDEKLRMACASRSIFQRAQAQHFLYENGLLEADWLNQTLQYLRGMTQLPALAEWWEIDRQQHQYTEAFINAVETAKPIDAFMLGIKAEDRKPPEADSGSTDGDGARDS